MRRKAPVAGGSAAVSGPMGSPACQQGASMQAQQLPIPGKVQLRHCVQAGAASTAGGTLRAQRSNPPLTACHVPRVWVAAEDAAQAAALDEDQEAHAGAVHGGEGLDGVDGAHDLGHLVGRRRAGSRREVEGWRPLPPLAGLRRWRRLRRRAPGRRGGREAAPKELQRADCCSRGQRGPQAAE